MSPRRLSSQLILLLSIALSLLASLGRASAQHIDMSTLPPRDSVQLTIYNSEDLTLVRETRRITVAKGVTELQFSWANTLIDPTSVTLRLPDRRLELIDTRFPHERPQTLHWAVRSEFDGDTSVEISYFTSGISWAADYVGVVARDDASMRFDGFVTITNNSGEDYDNASVRMVVGTINLVEAVRELAQRGLVAPDLADEMLRREQSAPAPDAMMSVELGRVLAESGTGGDMKAKSIEKSALSEYFLFTVPGEETVKNGWSKRMRLFTQKGEDSVPFRIEYRYRPQEYGDRLVRLILVRNDTASGLGESPLPDGMVRLFREVGSTDGAASAGDGLSVLGFLSTKYVPIGQEFEFNLGPDPQVILERLALSHAREEFWFRAGDQNRLVSPTRGERIDPKYALSGWNERVGRVERIRNYRGTPITVAWRFPIDGDVTVRAGAEMKPTAKLFDFRTPEFSATVGAGETRDLGYEVIHRRGSNERQAKVELEVSE
jgi:hypothetical protein